MYVYIYVCMFSVIRESSVSYFVSVYSSFIYDMCYVWKLHDTVGVILAHKLI